MEKGIKQFDKYIVDSKTIKPEDLLGMASLINIEDLEIDTQIED